MSSITAREVDLRDPLAAGLFELTAGRAAEAPDEVVVNDVLVERGVADRGHRDRRATRDLEVVGIRSPRDGARHRHDRRAARTRFGPDFADYSPDVDWLVDGDPVTWSDVLALNRAGLVVTSRAVLADPPPVHEMAEQMGYDTGYGDALAIIALVVTMALLEVVLLAGPAFAVSARRQARSPGPDGRDRRHAAAGPAGGARVRDRARARWPPSRAPCSAWWSGGRCCPLAQRWSGQWFGPLDVRLAGSSRRSRRSGCCRRCWPPWCRRASRRGRTSSRCWPAVVATGRRPLRTPVLGVLLLAAGVALSAYGVSASSSGHWFIAIAAIVSVLGMILVVPVVVALVARLSRRLPLVLRYAARDAARHRTRTVPAVAAVAATVAGVVVTLGIAVSSDEAQNEASYSPSLPLGAAIVNVYPREPMNVDSSPCPRGPGTRSRRRCGRGCPTRRCSAASSSRAPAGPTSAWTSASPAIASPSCSTGVAASTAAWSSPTRCPMWPGSPGTTLDRRAGGPRLGVGRGLRAAARGRGHRARPPGLVRRDG